MRVSGAELYSTVREAEIWTTLMHLRNVAEGRVLDPRDSVSVAVIHKRATAARRILKRVAS